MRELKNITVKVRKYHTCAWCGQLIMKNEKAQYRVGVFEGDFGTDYMHLECAAALNRYPFEDNEGFMPGCFKRGTTIDKWDTE